ncbi:MAG: hypothetical protein OXB98_06510 [Bryobacterales bacterium]|nr:hypothetical protein [Bryobacterales bacterium]
MIRDRVNGRVCSYDGNLRTMVEADLSRSNQAALDERYLGNNPDCQTDPKPYLTYPATPAIANVLNYRTVKHTTVIEPAPCGGDDCSPQSWAKSVSVRWDCLPVRGQ